MKKCLIVTNFGNFPNYFPLFLNSVRHNTSFNWMIITDNETPYDFPPNIRILKMTFDECREHFQKFFDFPIALNRPHKMGDFKPAYGYVFEEYLKDYDYWGYCDLDVIYGDLNHFYPDDFIEQYEKIGTVGHFTLFKNTSEINRLFMNPYKDKLPFKIALGEDTYRALDEWHSTIGSVNHIFSEQNRAFFNQDYVLNFDASMFSFHETTPFDVIQKKYGIKKTQGLIVSKSNVKVFKHEISGSKVLKEEYAYLHLHKRSMAVEVDQTENDFLIVPNRFIPFQKEINAALIKEHSKKPIIDRQYFKIKYRNLLTKLKILLGIKQKY